MKPFDSTVLIAHLRGVTDATRLRYEAVADGAAACGLLSGVDIEGGMRTNGRSAVARLFSVLELQPVTDLIAIRAGGFLRSYRRSHPGIDVTDDVVAATADLLGAELLTLDVKHFPCSKG